MVLAAGVGSRLDPLTTQVPKPLVPIANRPVLEHILRLLKKQGITQVISNLHHLPDQLTDYFGNGQAMGMDLQFHLEEELSGDAGGVRACQWFLEDDTFLVMMGDLVSDIDLGAVLKQHKQKGALATIALKQVADVSQLGVAVLNQEGFITGFQEKPSPQSALSNLASTGIYILEAEVFKHIPAQGSYGFGRQLFPSLVKAGAPILGVDINNYWSDVGTIKQYRQSNFDALEGKVSLELPGTRHSWGYLGENSDISSSASIDGLIMLGNNSRISAGVKIKGKVIVGDNCVIGPHAELEDTIVWSSTIIESKAVLRNSVIGLNCVVNGSANLQEQAVVPTSIQKSEVLSP